MRNIPELDINFASNARPVMRTTNLFPQFRHVLIPSVLLFLVSAGAPAQDLNRSQLPPPMLQTSKPLEGDSQFGPLPPCGTDPIPPYPALDNPAVVKSWNRSTLGRDWIPPSCANWTQIGFTTLVTIAARFQYHYGAEGLLRHVGAISELAGTRYWSTTHKQWRTLIVDAYALSDSRPAQRRSDFSVAELKAGKAFYFEQVDNLSGNAVYRLDIVDASENRIVFDLENVTTMRYHLIPILHPGELQSMYFLDRESDNVWRFYSIVRIGKNASGLILGSESSSVNRAVAFYRHLVGVPDTQEPPGAR